MSELEHALCTLRDARVARAAQMSPAVAAQLDTLRIWQSRRIAALHRERARRYKGDPLLQFLTRRFYLEADWSELIDQPQTMAGRIGRIIRDPRPLVIAARLQTSADAFDAAVARALLEQPGSPSLTRRRYVHAFRAVGQVDRREQQIAWIDQLVALLGDYADNRAAYWAFKLAAGPARALGMGRTYDMLAEGFAAMRATRDLKGATREAVAVQRDMLDRLLPG